MDYNLNNYDDIIKFIKNSKNVQIMVYFFADVWYNANINKLYQTSVRLNL